MLHGVHGTGGSRARGTGHGQGKPGVGEGPSSQPCRYSKHCSISSDAAPPSDLAMLRSIIGYLAVRRDERWLTADPRVLEGHLPSVWRSKPVWLLLACLDLQEITPTHCQIGGGPTEAEDELDAPRTAQRAS